MIKRAFELRDTCRYEVKINDGGFYRGMTQEVFDGINIGAVGQQVGCKGVS